MSTMAMAMAMTMMMIFQQEQGIPLPPLPALYPFSVPAMPVVAGVACVAGGGGGVWLIMRIA